MAIKIAHVLDTGPCDTACERANTNGLVMDISGTHIFLCDFHSKVMIRRMLKQLGYSSELRRQIR